MLQRPIPLLDFSPDLPVSTPGILIDCSNLVGTAKGLRALPGFRLIEGANIGGRHTIGCYTATLSNGTYATFATVLRDGANSGIYRYDPATDTWFLFQGTLSDATRMRFSTFGNHVLAANGMSPPLIWRDGTDPDFVHLFSVSDLPNDYIASTVCVVDYGVFLIEAGSDRWWFSLSDLLWTPGVQNGVYRSGVVGLAGAAGTTTGAFPIRGGIAMFKANSLHMGSFTGGQYFWQFDTVSATVGCQWQEAVINAGDYLLFVGPDDFWQFDGSSLTPIPNNLREWFFRRFRPLQSDFTGANAFSRIIGTWDSASGTAIWYYGLPADPDGTLSEWVALNTRTGKWTKGNRLVTDVILPFFPVRDADQHVIQRVPGIMDETFTLALQDGPPDPSFLLTGEYGDDGKFYQLNRLRPVFSEYPSDRAAHLQAYKRNQVGYPYPDLSSLPKDSLGEQAWLTDDGAFDLIQTARSHQFRIEFQGNAEISAIEADFVYAGEE